MPELEHYRKSVVTVSADTSVGEAAERMREEGVGCLVVLAEDRHPVGIVTDRDLTIRVVAAGRDAKTPVSAVMSHPLVTLAPNDRIERFVEHMGAQGFRRIPVVREKEVVGLVTLDDLLVALGEELGNLGEATRREFRSARRAARMTHVRREIEETVEDLQKGVRKLLPQLERVTGEAREALAKKVDGIRDRLKRLM
jgi:CBS domain-containing protein